MVSNPLIPAGRVPWVNSRLGSTKLRKHSLCLASLCCAKVNGIAVKLFREQMRPACSRVLMKARFNLSANTLKWMQIEGRQTANTRWQHLSHRAVEFPHGKHALKLDPPSPPQRPYLLIVRPTIPANFPSYCIGGCMVRAGHVKTMTRSHRTGNY